MVYDRDYTCNYGKQMYLLTQMTVNDLNSKQLSSRNNANCNSAKKQVRIVYYLYFSKPFIVTCCLCMLLVNLRLFQFAGIAAIRGC